MIERTYKPREPGWLRIYLVLLTVAFSRFNPKPTVGFQNLRRRKYGIADTSQVYLVFILFSIEYAFFGIKYYVIKVDGEIIAA
jgi:hypothetical protein